MGRTVLTRLCNFPFHDLVVMQQTGKAKVDASDQLNTLPVLAASKL